MVDKELQNVIASAIAKAKELCETYQYQAAETFCRQVIKIDPKNGEAWFLLGVTCGCNGKKEEASAAFAEAAELTPIPENRAYAIEMRARLL